MNKYLIFTSMGFELVGIMLACIYLGQMIDQTYQTKGFGLVALMFIGLFSWLLHMIMLLRRLQKDDPDDKAE